MSTQQRVVRAVIVDDHPVIRTGVRAVLDAAPDLELVGEAAGADDVWPVMDHVPADVVLVDFHIPGEDSLVLCYRLKRAAPATHIVMYSAYADESLIGPALLAQADAMVAKRAPADVLRETVREVAAGAQPSRTLAISQLERLRPLLAAEDAALAGLLLLRASPAEMASRLGLDDAQLIERVEQMLRHIAWAWSPSI
jgi:DNA-binding NarL/FixJ family response regulator